MGYGQGYAEGYAVYLPYAICICCGGRASNKCANFAEPRLIKCLWKHKLPLKTTLAEGRSTLRSNPPTHYISPPPFGKAPLTLIWINTLAYTQRLGPGQRGSEFQADRKLLKIKYYYHIALFPLPLAPCPLHVAPCPLPLAHWPLPVNH